MVGAPIPSSLHKPCRLQSELPSSLHLRLERLRRQISSARLDCFREQAKGSVELLVNSMPGIAMFFGPAMLALEESTFGDPKAPPGMRSRKGTTNGPPGSQSIFSSRASTWRSMMNCKPGHDPEKCCNPTSNYPWTFQQACLPFFRSAPCCLGSFGFLGAKGSPAAQISRSTAHESSSKPK